MEDRDRNQRLLTMLMHLSASEWKRLPRHVGSKAAQQAKELGYAQSVGKVPNETYRLTVSGIVFLQQSARMSRRL